MKLFAENGGALNWDSTTAWRKQREPLKDLEKLRRSLTPILSRMRNDIVSAIVSASPGKFDVEAIDDPLPLIDGTWCAQVEIGFAVQNDAGRLEFKRKEDM
jgi:hypothetical protein